MEKLSRKWVLMDKRGRITISDYIRKAMNLSMDGNQPLLIEVVPNLKDAKAIIIKRGD